MSTASAETAHLDNCGRRPTKLKIRSKYMTTQQIRVRMPVDIREEGIPLPVIVQDL